MVEITEAMKRLGITQEVFQRWQEEEDPMDEPGPFQTHGDTLILEQRRAESAARASAAAIRKRNGHSNGAEKTAEATSAELARPGVTTG